MPTAIAEQTHASVKDAKAHLLRMYWVDGALRLEGWCRHERLVGSQELKGISVCVVDVDTGQFTVAKSRVTGLFADASTKPGGREPSRTAFVAEIDSDCVLRRGGGPGHFQVVVRASSDDLDVVTPFTGRDERSSAGSLVGDWSGGLLLVPAWDQRLGLVVKSSRPQVTTSAMPERTTDGVIIRFQAHRGFVPVATEWGGAKVSPAADIALSRVDSAGAGEVVVSGLQGSGVQSGQWSIRLVDRAGRRRRLHWQQGVSREQQLPLGGADALERGKEGMLRLVRGAPSAVATSIKLIDDETVALGVELRRGAQLRIVSVELEGNRAMLAGKPAAGTFLIPLSIRSWRGHLGAPPSGSYRARALLEDGTALPVQIGGEVGNQAGGVLRASGCLIRIERDPVGLLHISIAAPLEEDEAGPLARRRLGRMHTGRKSSAASGVFLESWYGKTFSDNPAALVGALRKAEVPGPYYAAVADLSVDVPASVVPVVVGSRNYWRALGECRFVIFNTWFPSDFTKGAGQFLLQTWHGTPLKTLGVDTPERAGKEQSARRLEAGSQAWDLLVTQSPYATQTLRRAYRYRGAVVEGGYPRNDLLASAGRDAHAVRVREWLGIAPDARVVLYAPTWREEAKGQIGPLDIGALVSRLPDDVVILARGHSVALRRGENISHDRVVDVTSYPEPAELMIASDCLLTDYSSIMFDYAVLRRPMVFYVPDYESYTGGGRGTYFDLRKTAPGPVVGSEGDLAGCVERLLSSEYVPDAVYEEWIKKYCPMDDAGAADRVVQAMLRSA